jgi:hypothetical protein
MSATVTLETPHPTHLRTRVLATGAVLAVIAGGTAFALTARDNTTTKPTPAVSAAPAADSHVDPLVGRYGQAPTETLDQQLTITNSHR